MSEYIKDYIDESVCDLLGKIGVIAIDNQYTELFKHFEPIIEVHIAMLHIPKPEAFSPDDRLDFIPQNLSTELAEQIDLRFPQLTLAAKAVLWNELSRALFDRADHFFVSKLRDMFLKDEAGLGQFINALTLYRRR